MIAFIGSVFSPYYAWARRRGPADPRQHCAVNVALYGARGGRWAMTERGRRALLQRPDTLQIGPSTLDWDGNALTVRLDEIGAPLPKRIRGRITLIPGAVTDRTFTLDDYGRHGWRPIAPTARIEVALRRPSLRWSGNGYLDTNAGEAPLEDDFVKWDWSRAAHGRGAAVLYNVTRRHGGDHALALRFDRSARPRPFRPRPRRPCPAPCGA